MPFVVTPSYYAWRDMLLPEQGIVRTPFQFSFWSDVYEHWRGGVVEITTAFWKIWIPAHVVTFGLCPAPLRITWVAAMSFIWLTIHSTLSHKNHATGAIEANAKEEKKTGNNDNGIHDD